MTEGAPNNADRALTLRDLSKMAARGERFACLTCYDATTARWLARGGVHLLLVGDTAAETVLGFERTIDMPLDFSITLTAGVKRGAPGCVVMGDMPFMSYHADHDDAIRNAGRYLTEGLADIVKLEVDGTFAPLITRMTAAGIPVCGHIGAKPQHTMLHSGYRSAGRRSNEADMLLDDARRLEDAGAVMLLIEATPDEVAERVVEAVGVPVIGIGAGVAPHGQVLVMQDLMGMSDWTPRFASPITNLGEQIRDAAARWTATVRDGQVGGGWYRSLGPDSPDAK